MTLLTESSRAIDDSFDSLDASPTGTIRHPYIDENIYLKRHDMTWHLVCTWKVDLTLTLWLLGILVQSESILFRQRWLGPSP